MHMFCFLCRNHPVLQRGISLPENTSDSSTIIESNSANHVTIVEVESQSAPQPEVFNFDNLSLVPQSQVASDSTLDISNTHYERLYHLQSPGIVMLFL